jgi:hypothetical protein
LPDTTTASHRLQDATIRVPEHVVHRSFVSETVVLNLQTGKYHGVNPSGGRMLEALERHGSINPAAAALADEFEISPAELENDLVEFCLSLKERGLIEIVEPGAS